MDKNDLLLLFEFNRWANARVLSACDGLPEETLRLPVQASFGSLMGTLAHIYAAEAIWRLRMEEGVSPTRLAAVEDFPHLPALKARWVEEEESMRHFLEQSSDESLQAVKTYTTTSGSLELNTVWKVLAHVVMHSVQFRAEAGVVLAVLGHSPGDLDLIHFLRASGNV